VTSRKNSLLFWYEIAIYYHTEQLQFLVCWCAKIYEIWML